MSGSASGAVLDEHTARRVANLRVRVRRAVAGLRSGIHRSPHRGASVIFAEHRNYRPGDDLRLLDWRAYARNDRHAIKHFEQETHLKAHLLLDRSASMDYGGDAKRDSEAKDAYAATLLSALAFILLGQGDSVGGHVLDAGVRDSVQPRNRSEHLESILRLFGAPRPNPEPTDLGAALSGLGQRLGRRALIVLASDLLDFTPHALEPLAQLAVLGHDVRVFQVMHPDELDFPFRDKVRFEDPESDQTLDADGLALRDSYRDTLTEFLDECRSRCTAAGARYTLARTDTPVQQVVAEALSSRGARTWA